jgi:hypothetical protein
MVEMAVEYYIKIQSWDLHTGFGINFTRPSSIWPFGFITEGLTFWRNISICSFAILGSFQTMLHYNPEDCTLHNPNSKNLKSNIIT